MKMGLLADIHADVQNLGTAIKQLRQEKVDRFVVLGDVIYDRRNATETVKLLEDCGAIGVWGNHELGLSVEPDEAVRKSYAVSVQQFFHGLSAQLQVRDVLFSHTLPTEDAADPLAYFLGGHLDDCEALRQVFDRCPHRAFMIGHFHRWFAATPAGPIGWDGSEPLELHAECRYLIAIHAVMYGWAAVFDDVANVVTPIRL